MATPTCESCGARIEPAHLTCPFCNAATPFGLKQREEDEHARRSQDAARAHAAQQIDLQARGVARAELEMLGRQSAIWSVVGLVFCCLPVPSLVALVLAYRARVVAREKGFVFPAQATIGFLLAILTMLLSTGFYAFVGVSAVQKQRRIHALESDVAETAAAETLDHDTACKLIELHLLEHGLTSSSDNIGNLACDGALEQHGPTAIVHDVTFDVSSAPHTTDAVLKRGERWLVERLTEGSSRPHAAPEAPKSAPTPALAAPAIKGEPSPGHAPPAHHAPPAPPAKPH